MKFINDVVKATLVAALMLVLSNQTIAQDATTDAQPAAEAKQELKTIAESIDPNTFSTLYNAVVRAELVETLKGDGPFTVFAPNDAGFGTIPLADTQNLFMDGNQPLLAAVLTNHVVSGKVMAADVAGMSEAKAVSGDTLKIEAKDGVVTINGVVVSTTDIECSNGVIHVIDGVLLPSAETMEKAKAAVKAAAEKAAADAKAAAEVKAAADKAAADAKAAAEVKAAADKAAAEAKAAAEKSQGSESK